MDWWNDDIITQLRTISQSDEHYMWLKREMEKAEPEFLKIRKKLNTEELHMLDTYIALCEDMEYIKTQLAYILGRMDR